jgi:hypothetical protein
MRRSRGLGDVYKRQMVASTETSDDGVGEVIKEHFGIEE